MSDAPPKLKTKTYNINNQNLFKEIDKFMIDMFSSLEVNWENEVHREQLVELVEDTMLDIAMSTGKIVRCDVICDRRNNPKIIRKNGTVHFTIKYVQKNCLNTTVIDYIFSL